MHELSIAQSIISIAEKTVPLAELEKINTIKLQIGTLSGIEIDALTYSFAIIIKNTPYPEARLDIEMIESMAVCRDCNITIEYKSFGNACPSCNGYNLKITKGKEMKVVNITTF